MPMMDTTQSTIAKLAAQLKAQSPTTDWNIQGIDRATELAGLMAQRGITDISQLSTGTLEGNGYKAPTTSSGGGNAVLNHLAQQRGDLGGTQLKIGDQAYGFLGDVNQDGGYTLGNSPVLQDNNRLGWSSAGHGNVSYVLKDGKIVPEWASSSDAYVARDLASIGAVIGGGLAIGNAVGGAAGAAGEAGAAGAGAGAGEAAGAGLGGAGAGAGEAAGAGLGGAGGGGGLGATGASIGTETGMLGGTEGLTGLSSSLPQGFIDSAGLSGAGEAAGLGGAASGAGGGSGGLSAGLSSADKAALYGAEGYGAPGFTGTAGSVFDGVLNATGSPGLASKAGELASGGVGDAVSSAWDWLKDAGGSVLDIGGSIFKNPLLSTLIGAGINQWNLEKMQQDQRDWLKSQEDAKRARQAPVGMLNAKLTVNKGAKSNG